MNSQLTQFDACGSPSEEDTILIFDRDDMRNTTLRILGGHLPCYSVETLKNTTTVWAGDSLLATVARRKFRLDYITFPGSKPVNLGSWLKAPILSSSPSKFRAYRRRFKWQDDSPGRLTLHESGRPGDALAWFSRSRTDFGDHPMGAAYLAIKPEMAEMRDLIVLSCLLTEHKLRGLSAAQGKTFFDIMILGF